MLRIDEELTRLAVLENPTEVASSNPKNIGSQINKTVTGLLSGFEIRCVFVDLRTIKTTCTS